MTPLRLGTRGSPLALWQARAAAEAIAAAGGPPCETVVIRTSGDRFADAELARIGGKRLFVKEIEEALLAGDIDVAVHSAKDLPADPPDRLAVAAALPREEPWDALVLRAGLDAPADNVCSLVCRLGRDARVGTGSVRRTSQLRRLMPGARFAPLRGNVETRLRRLDAGEHDLLVLAAAGLRRLGLGHRITMTLPPNACVPAPGQGIVALQIRADDERARGVVAPAGDALALAALEAERAQGNHLGGTCQVPLGALALPEGEELALQAVVTSLDGARALRREDRGPLDAPARLGRRAAEALLAQGAAEILAEVGQVQARHEDVLR